VFCLDVELKFWGFGVSGDAGAAISWAAGEESGSTITAGAVVTRDEAELGALTPRLPPTERVSTVCDVGGGVSTEERESLSAR
jgi:hypothetical protein